jgi:hypothetical protein
MSLWDKLFSSEEKEPDIWEDLPGGLYRTPCPGGWIYGMCIPGHSFAITFVPTPKENKDE